LRFVSACRFLRANFWAQRQIFQPFFLPNIMACVVERWLPDGGERALGKDSRRAFSADKWDAFVWRSENGTIFHERAFLEYHPPKRFTDHSLLFRVKGNVRALFPAIEWQIDKDKTLYSHRGASYGGFVCEELSIENALDYVRALKQYAAQEGFSRIILTPPPMLYGRRPTNYIEYALLREGFRYQKRELTAIVPVPPSEDEILSLWKQEARTAMRKARKSGVSVRLSDDYEAYFEILSHNLMMRHGVTPTHSLTELQYLAQRFPERIELWAAYTDETMIAGVVNFLANERVTLAFYISDNKEYQDLRALNLVFYEIFRRCRERGAEYYDFGTFTLNMQPNMGLGKFKETFGAQGVFRDTFEIWL
jgi:hypothetical protein